MPVSVKKNTLYNIVKTLSAVIFPLIAFPYVSRVLHAENIGKVNFGNSIISYISLIASLGISTYAIRECSKVKNDRQKLSDLSGQILSINLISTLIAYITLGTMFLCWRALDGYQLLIAIQATSILFTTLGADYLNIAMEDFKFITIRTIVFQIISITALFVFIHKPEHYLIYATIGVVSSSGANITNIVYRKRYCTTKFTFHINWKQHLKPILLLFTLYLSQIVYVNVDTTMLGIMRGDFEVGLYSTATSIYHIVNFTVASVSQVVLSKLSYHYSQKERDYSKINQLLRFTLQFIITFGLPCVVGLNILAPEIIQIMAGTEYAGASPALQILTIALLFSFLGGFVGNSILIPQGKDRICLINCCCSALLNFILNVIFIPKWGLYAAAGTTAVSELFCFCASLFFVEKDVKITEKAKIFIPPVIGCLIMVIIALVLKNFIETLIIRTILIVSFCVVIYALTLIIFRNELAISFLSSLKNFIKGKE